MNTLSFHLKHPLKHPLDVSCLCPERLNGISLDAIRALQLRYGIRHVSVGELFRVQGKSSRHIVFSQGSKQLCQVARNMCYGEITVQGDSGENAGRGMRGGRLRIAGNAGDWTGRGMHGGQLWVTGNAGDFTGAAEPSEPHGMNGGSITILGNAGQRTGDHMRRGLIVVHGNTGNYCASRMLAGTIAVFGKTGVGIACGMRRGSLILADQKARLPASFGDCGEHDFVFLRLLWQQLALSDVPTAERAVRYAGDKANNGNGEILVLKRPRR